MSNLEELKNLGLTGATEVKFENSISRTTAVANPRQIERVVRGAQFPMQLIYEFSNDIDVDTLLQDFKILKRDFVFWNTITLEEAAQEDTDASGF